MANLNIPIGRLVKKIRKGLGMRQTKFGEALGLDQSALSRVENGIQSLTAAQWVVVGRLAGFKTDRLVNACNAPVDSL